MDPASLGLGAASLSLQLLEGAVKAFHYFDSAANAEKDCAYLKVQLHFEYSSLLRWGHESGLLKESVQPKFDARIEHQEMVIIAILSQLKLSLRDLRKLCLRYDGMGEKQSDGVPEGLQSALDLARTGVKDLSEPTVQKTQEVDAVQAITKSQILSQAEWERYKAVLDTGEQVRTARVHAKGTNHIRSWVGGFSIGVKKIVTEPKRFVWAAVDKAKFQGLLDKVKSLVSSLLRTLTQDQMAEVLQVVQEIRLLLLSVTKTKEGMQALKVEHSTSASLSGSTLVENQSFGRARLESLPEESVQAEIQFNMFYSQAVNFFIDVKSHVGLAQKPLDPVTNKIEYADQHLEHDSRTKIKFAGEPAWVEWKPYNSETWWNKELSISDTRAPAKAKESAELLSALLSFPRKPQEFCLPPFQGMFDDTKQNRFGFVFKEPPESRDNSLGVTLHSRLLEPSPPLHERVELAQQLSQWLLYLHSVTWLHKSISSTSIMFFPVEGGGYSRAYFGGFEYARLVQSGTTGGNSDLRRALYTHPKYLPGIASGFRQTYDMYALGIVLIELAFWQPVRQIFGFGESGSQEELKLPAIVDAHEALMRPESTVMKDVERLMGKRYTSAAHACIQGMPAFGLPDEKDQAEPLISGLLQQAFIRVVVGPLKTIAV
ncbi:hypothetical protein CKM354_001150600 [Cercospora kikuchii]|uniref:Prion-inhibition and propagation HeLo domain-containing protein n=1 Tax=Cercospora kikuchii TaxID=84275 RepID=A0A9P3CT83_9PEZI|nr:uncharacterized protein CKM354_001150600 [Cercospora kikuchii]GIZ48446.1 hypothetical protein CKM354_001150600 [Cercospora kikuchii]